MPHILTSHFFPSSTKKICGMTRNPWFGTFVFAHSIFLPFPKKEKREGKERGSNLRPWKYGSRGESATPFNCPGRWRRRIRSPRTTPAQIRGFFSKNGALCYAWNHWTQQHLFLSGGDKGSLSYATVFVRTHAHKSKSSRRMFVFFFFLFIKKLSSPPLQWLTGHLTPLW